MHVENIKILENYLHTLRDIEEIMPGPVEIEAISEIIENAKDAKENTEYAAFAWDKDRGIYVQIGRPVSVKQLCMERYIERTKNGDIPTWIEPNKYRILKRTVVEIQSDWKEAINE